MGYNFTFDPRVTFQRRLVEHLISRRRPFLFILNILSIVLGLSSLVVIIFTLLGWYAAPPSIFGLAIIFLVIFLNFLAYNIFFYQERRHLEIDFTLKEAFSALNSGQNINIAELFYLNTTDLYLRINKDPANITLGDYLRAFITFSEIDFILKRMGTDKEKLLEYATDEPVKNEEIVFEALRIAAAENHDFISIGDLFAAFCLKTESLNRYLFSLHLKEEDMLNIVYWETQIVREKWKKLFDPQNLVLNGGIGRDWAFGYTPNLNRYAHDITALAASPNADLHREGYEQEIVELENALVTSSTKNAVLVGEPGIGKKTVVYAFAKRVYSGETYGALSNKHILELDLGAALAGAQSEGDISGRLHVILTEAAYAGNIILFIDRIDELFSVGDESVGKIDASAILMPYLELPQLGFIGTTTPGLYHKLIESNTSLRDHFQKIGVAEPDEGRVIRIMESVAPLVERKTGVVLTYLALKEVVKLADRVYVNKTNPEKSIDLLDQVSVNAASQGIALVAEQNVQDTVTAKTGVEVGEIREEEKSKLLNLEDYLHKRIVNQEEAIRAVANAMRRSRAEIEESKKPMGSFLFLGPTGVGKTETSKALAESYFGSEEAMIRFDMSEYQTKESIYRLIGDEQGGSGLLSERIFSNPHALVLFDEAEKADPGILNLFLQMLDEGFITDTVGRKIIFSNTIIIATSNAGSEYIREGVKNNVDYEAIKAGLMEELQQKGIFRPEFINRFTAVILFSPLSTEQTREVAKMMVERLRLRLETEKEIKLDIGEAAIAELALKGYSPEFGARALERTIQESLENVLAKKMISGEIQRGATVRIDREDINVV